MNGGVGSPRGGFWRDAEGAAGDGSRRLLDEHVSVRPAVDGDRRQRYQRFQNLLVNAVEYSGDAPPRIHVAAEHHGGELRVDTQPGEGTTFTFPLLAGGENDG
jgi:signal transduction histidine kinase